MIAGRNGQAAAGIQIIADFASCLLLGSLLLDKIREGDDVPTALLVGYATSAFGFVLFFGPAVASFNLKLGCSCDAYVHKQSTYRCLCYMGILCVCSYPVK